MWDQQQPLSLFSLTLGAGQLGRLQEPAFKRQLNWESSCHSLHHISSSTLLNVIVIIIIKSHHCIFYIGHWTSSMLSIDIDQSVQENMTEPQPIQRSLFQNIYRMKTLEIWLKYECFLQRVKRVSLGGKSSK